MCDDFAKFLEPFLGKDLHHVVYVLLRAFDPNVRRWKQLNKIKLRKNKREQI